MRPQEVLELIDQAKLEDDIEFFPADSYVSSLPAFRAKLDALLRIPGFEREQKFFYASAPYKSATAELQIPSKEWRQLSAEWAHFTTEVSGLKRYLTAVIAQQANDSVFIKLPPEKDLGKTADYMKTFDKLLKQVLLDTPLGAKVEIKGCETGSIWIEVCVGANAAVGFIGGIGWAAAVVYKKIQEGRMHAEYVKSLAIKNEFLQAITDKQRELMSALVETEALNLAKNHYGEDTKPEQLERVKHTIKEFADLIGKGAEIHPALQAPESVQNLFPDYNKILQIESKTKMIQDESTTSA